MTLIKESQEEQSKRVPIVQGIVVLAATSEETEGEYMSVFTSASSYVDRLNTKAAENLLHS